MSLRLSTPARTGLLIAVLALIAGLLVLPLSGFATSSTDRSVTGQQANGDRTCELHVRWSMCAWPGPSGMSVGAAFEGNTSADGDISDRVTAIYTWVGEDQRWISHFPQFADVPGANDFGTFTAGTGYWIAITDGPNLTWTAPTEVPDATPTPEPDLGTLTVHYIDVGQGDATLIEGPDFAILIDAGRHTANDVVPYLQSVGITGLDLLVGTHPHADHIGQFPQVLQNFTVNEVWLSGDLHTTLTFENAIDAIEASDADYHEPRAGESYSFGGGTLEVVNPATLTGDFHEGSIAIRFVWGDVAFMFTGDAEAATEQAMINRGHNLQAQIYQVGHHGSNTSSSQALLDAMQLEVAIYSASEGNQYGHPHVEVLQRFAAMGIEVYGTNTHGTVLVTTDGTTYEVETQTGTGPQPPPGTPVPATATPTSAPATATPPQQCVNINTASYEDLQLIVNVGPVIAQRIIDDRPFASVDDLINVTGIGPTTLQQIKDQGLACV